MLIRQWSGQRSLKYGMKLQYLHGIELHGMNKFK